MTPVDQLSEDIYNRRSLGKVSLLFKLTSKKVFKNKMAQIKVSIKGKSQNFGI